MWWRHGLVLITPNFTDVSAPILIPNTMCELSKGGGGNSDMVGGASRLPISNTNEACFMSRVKAAVCVGIGHWKNVMKRSVSVQDELWYPVGASRPKTE